MHLQRVSQPFEQIEIVHGLHAYEEYVKVKKYATGWQLTSFDSAACNTKPNDLRI